MSSVTSEWLNPFVWTAIVATVVSLVTFLALYDQSLTLLIPAFLCFMAVWWRNDKSPKEKTPMKSPDSSNLARWAQFLLGTRHEILILEQCFLLPVGTSIHLKRAQSLVSAQQKPRETQAEPVRSTLGLHTNHKTFCSAHCRPLLLLPILPNPLLFVLPPSLLESSIPLPTPLSLPLAGRPPRKSAQTLSPCSVLCTGDIRADHDGISQIISSWRNPRPPTT